MATIKSCGASPRERPGRAALTTGYAQAASKRLNICGILTGFSGSLKIERGIPGTLFTGASGAISRKGPGMPCPDPGPRLLRSRAAVQLNRIGAWNAFCSSICPESCRQEVDGVGLPNSCQSRLGWNTSSSLSKVYLNEGVSKQLSYFISLTRSNDTSFVLLSLAFVGYLVHESRAAQVSVHTNFIHDRFQIYLQGCCLGIFFLFNAGGALKTHEVITAEGKHRWLQLALH